MRPDRVKAQKTGGDDEFGTIVVHGLKPQLNTDSYSVSQVPRGPMAGVVRRWILRAGSERCLPDARLQRTHGTDCCYDFIDTSVKGMGEVPWVWKDYTEDAEKTFHNRGLQ
ncbi:hypothetical protein DPMN_147055 [Dreissena polymorpha]|uniref:Uncharacterized protein n=1 Tax=Dreissena polymorpha TaxID=45954 RepID=A0A9D4FBH8_DREPO|nr:hypothetical protein DPMN_147055 [Dreissena polymorpha]